MSNEYDFNNFNNNNGNSENYNSYNSTSNQGADSFGGYGSSSGQSYSDPYSNPYDYAREHSQSTPYQQAYESAQQPYSAPQQSPYTPSDFNEPEKKKKGKGKKFLSTAAVMCAVALAGGCGVYIGANVVGSGTSASANAAVPSASTVASTDNSGEVTSNITQVVDNAMPSMVSINTVVTTSMDNDLSSIFGYFFGDNYNNQTYETSASGSGIIIGQNDEELLIATNNHVVEDSTEIMVEFIDGETYSAAVKGTAPDSDLAVISVAISDISAETLSEIKVAVLGDSTKLKLGEPAIAIGNSLGYGQSVTVGYISATEREVQLTDKTMTLIQTDAAINPGNSGGALLNIKGEVIGINSAKYSDTSVEGTGYAIPISDAEPIINALINSTYVTEDETPYLGIYGADVPASYQKRLGWPAGVYVSQVTQGSPASLAGLKEGDIITSFNGVEVTTMESLQEEIAKCSVGDSVELNVTRYDGDKKKEGKLTATLIARSDVEAE